MADKLTSLGSKSQLSPELSLKGFQQSNLNWGINNLDFNFKIVSQAKIQVNPRVFERHPKFKITICDQFF